MIDLTHAMFNIRNFISTKELNFIQEASGVIYNDMLRFTI